MGKLSWTSWASGPSWATLLGWTGGCVIAGILAAAGLPLLWAYRRSSGRVRDLSTVPPARSGLVLGAGVRSDGQPSLILRGRLSMARRLYACGKVQHLIVSGSPYSRGFSEPIVMRDWLTWQGIPESAITMDESGVDTWSSCRFVAAQGIAELTVVTTLFHLRRSVALCRRAGIDAYGVGHDARAMGLDRVVSRGQRREIFATMKAFWWSRNPTGQSAGNGPGSKSAENPPDQQDSAL